MSLLPALLLGFAAILVASGLFTLVSAWMFPNVLDRPFLRWMSTGKVLAPTRSNRTLVGLSSLVFGGYCGFLALNYRTPSLLLLLAWFPLAFMMFRLRIRPTQRIDSER